MKKKYKDALKVGVGAAALGASNYLGKRAGEQDIAKKILASYTGDTDTVLKKTSAFGIAKPTARNKGGGMDMGKKNKYAKKNSKKLFGYEFTDEPQPGYTVTKKMNKGGGMDMGKKEEPTQWITKKEKPTQWITKKEKPKKWITKKSRGGGMDMGQMPNTVKPEPRGNPGIVENVVGKGGDYIKDLID